MIKDIADKYFKKVYIKESSVAGTGLYAGEQISKGEIILVFGGNLAVNDERYSGVFIRSTCIGVNESIILGEYSESKKELSDYINHSCVPNAGLLDAITLIAIEDIAVDSEILCDYAFWENNPNWEMKSACNCGSLKCRKKISGMDWKNFSSDNEYFKYFSPYIRRRILENEKK